MKNILIALFASLFISSAALAGQYGVGVTGSFAAVSGAGTESEQKRCYGLHLAEQVPVIITTL